MIGFVKELLCNLIIEKIIVKYFDCPLWNQNPSLNSWFLKNFPPKIWAQIEKYLPLFESIVSPE